MRRLSFRRLGSLRERWWFSYGSALAAVAVVTVLIGAIAGRTVIANISMLYLIAVLSVAVCFGSGPAVLASVAAFLAFNYFFVHPMHTLTVADPEEWVALVLFLITAVITGQLAADLRRRADEAEQRKREAVVLYDVVRLIAEPGFDRALGAVAERLRQELEADAVVVRIDDGPQLQARAAVGDVSSVQAAERSTGLSSHVLGVSPIAEGGRTGPGRWRRVVPASRSGQLPSAGKGTRYVVPIQMDTRRVGTLVVLERGRRGPISETDSRLLGAVAVQLAQSAERVRLRREATEAEVLRRSDELKSALLNAVSHDMRTPLATIIASAESLLQTDVTWSDDERREFAEAVVDEARRLDRIVGNLLDLSRMEAGSLRPAKGWYDVGALVEDVLDRLHAITDERSVQVDVPDDLPPVLFDYVEMDQVLSNLVENAAKYSPPGAEIRVAVRRAGPALEIEVADRGPGIPEAALPHLFTPFYRAGGSGPQPRGLGLGLAVVRGLVEAHGGSVRVENREGGGARFTVMLPLTPPPDGV